MQKKLKEIQDKVHELRHILSLNINLFYNNFDGKDWHILCASMDILEDSLEAIKAYIMGSCSGDDGGKYLKLYGLLQAVVMNQDALVFIYNLFTKGEKLKLRKNTRKMRDIRIIVAGHPASCREDELGNPMYSCFLNRALLFPWTLHLIEYNNVTGESKYPEINLKELLQNYFEDILIYLDMTITKIPEIWDDVETSWQIEKTDILMPLLPEGLRDLNI